MAIDIIYLVNFHVQKKLQKQTKRLIMRKKEV